MLARAYLSLDRYRKREYIPIATDKSFVITAMILADLSSSRDKYIERFFRFILSARFFFVLCNCGLIELSY